MKTNALELRQSLGKILKKLHATNEPIIVEKGRVPVAVLISIKSFQERFIDKQQLAEQQKVMDNFRRGLLESPEGDSLSLLRELRYGADH